VDPVSATFTFSINQQQQQQNVQKQQFSITHSSSSDGRRRPAAFESCRALCVEKRILSVISRPATQVLSQGELPLEKLRRMAMAASQ
jgi:hypothetical protein